MSVFSKNNQINLLHQLYFNASTKKWIFQCSVKSM